MMEVRHFKFLQTASGFDGVTRAHIFAQQVNDLEEQKNFIIFEYLQLTKLEI